MKAPSLQTLGDAVCHLAEFIRFGGGKSPERKLDSTIQGETPPGLGIPVVALGDGQAIGCAMLFEQAPEELLGTGLIELLENFRLAEQFARRSSDQEAGGEILFLRGFFVGSRGGLGNGLLKIEPEKPPAIECGVQWLDHGSSTFRVCLREKRSM